MAGGGVFPVLGAQRGRLGGSWHISESFSQQARPRVAVARMFLLYMLICVVRAPAVPYGTALVNLSYPILS